MNLKEIVFETVEPPKYNRKRREKVKFLIFIIVLAVCFLGVYLADYSKIFVIIGISSFLIFLFVVYLSDKKTLLSIVKNGTIKIDSSGISITQDIDRHIPFDQIKFITYYFDRPLDVVSKLPSARTYIIKIKTLDNLILKLYIERYPLSKYKEIYKDFDEVMDTIKKSKTYFAKRIQYKK